MEMLLASWIFYLIALNSLSRSSSALKKYSLISLFIYTSFILNLALSSSKVYVTFYSERANRFLSNCFLLISLLCTNYSNSILSIIYNLLSPICSTHI